MNLELIHHIQESFREVLQAMSRPGERRYINKERSIKETLGIMLLDGEVTFCIEGDNKDIIGRKFKEITGVVEKKEEADYVFLLKESDDPMKVIGKAKIGSLINPQKSTTIIKEFDKSDKLIKVEIKGPGIKGKKLIDLPCSKGELTLRDEKNKEYPLGIDMIFFSENGEIIGLPRTVKIEIKEENEWAM